MVELVQIGRKIALCHLPLKKSNKQIEKDVRKKNTNIDKHHSHQHHHRGDKHPLRSKLDLTQ